MRYLLLSLFLICSSSFAVSQGNKCKANFFQTVQKEIKAVQEEAQDIGTRLTEAPFAGYTAFGAVATIHGIATYDFTQILIGMYISVVSYVTVSKYEHKKMKTKIRDKTLYPDKDELKDVLEWILSLKPLRDTLSHKIINGSAVPLEWVFSKILSSKPQRSDFSDEIKLIVEKLSEEGVSVNDAITHQGTFMHLAAYYNNPRAIKTLYELEANIHTKNSTGKTPKDLAIKNKSRKAVKMLEKIEKAESSN